MCCFLFIGSGLLPASCSSLCVACCSFFVCVPLFVVVLCFVCCAFARLVVSCIWRLLLCCLSYSPLVVLVLCGVCHLICVVVRDCLCCA